MENESPMAIKAGGLLWGSPRSSPGPIARSSKKPSRAKSSSARSWWWVRWMVTQAIFPEGFGKS